MSIKIPKVPLYAKNIKFWGWVQSIAITDAIHVAHAYVKSGGFSSKHKHEVNYNRFHIVSGKLRIDIYRNDNEETVDLVSGDTLDIEPQVWHRMTALEDTHVIEIYWATDGQSINAEDIVREDNGGVKVPCVNIPTMWSIDINKTFKEQLKQSDISPRTDNQIPEEMAKVWCDQINNPKGSVDGY